jgi:hypothetical protein
MRTPKSVRSSTFQISVAPWLEEPIRCFCDEGETRENTLVKPIQTGGSTAGEGGILYDIIWRRGLTHYNWEDNDKARRRFDERIESILKACAPVAEKLARLPLYDATKCEIDFGNVYLRVQGAFDSSNLDSDSVPLQYNEELHNWKSGHMAKARGRGSAVWNFKMNNISNAGAKGGELQESFLAGTQKHWENLCPGCGLYHRMRTEWDDANPKLGGLRYDTFKHGNEYDYNRIEPTVRFQMPCGFEVPMQDIMLRRQLSAQGRYSKGDNLGAPKKLQSWTYQAVSVDFINWLDLIMEKHKALRALRLGDVEPWRKYRVERECLFYDANEAPWGGTINITSGVRKKREGLPDPKIRMFALDHQQGKQHENELPHWWGVIRDVKIEDESLRSLLVDETKLDLDDDIANWLFEDYKCLPWQGVADTGDEATPRYIFCLQYGINGIKGRKAESFTHRTISGSVQRSYSPESALHAILRRAPKYPYVRTTSGLLLPDPREPMFWLYSKYGIRERLHWMRTQTTYETPEDVSEAYKLHQKAEQRVERPHPRLNTKIVEYIERNSNNHQYVNECYISMLVDQSGMIWKKKNEQQNEKN